MTKYDRCGEGVREFECEEYIKHVLCFIGYMCIQHSTKIMFTDLQ